MEFSNFNRSVNQSIRTTLIASGLVAVSLVTGSAHAALQGRDLDRNGVIDAFYDTNLDITWLRDANVNGATGWNEAVDWAANFSIGTFTDWRLPTADLTCATSCTGGEIGHLWYVGLGNTAAGGLTNTGGFQGMQSFWYWSGNEIGVANVAHALDFRDGRQGTQFTSANSNQLYAMAVTNGDVAAVPEAETYALMLAGLGLVGFAARRRSM